MTKRLNTTIDQFALVSLCEGHLKLVLELEETIFSRVLQSEDSLTLDLGELFEDAANVFLRMSDEISARRLAAKRSEPA